MYQLVVAAMLLAPVLGEMCASPTTTHDYVTFGDEKMYGKGGFTLSVDVSCSGKRVKVGARYRRTGVITATLHTYPKLEEGSQCRDECI